MFYGTFSWKVQSYRHIWTTCVQNSQLSEGKVRRGDGISRFLSVRDRARFGSDRNSGVFFLPILWRAASSTLGLFSVYTMALSLKMTKL